MKPVIRLLCLLALALVQAPSWAAPQWYVGYSFIHGENGRYCAFMRFRADSHTLEQADTLYRYLGDRLAARAEAGAALSHTLPSAALAEGKTGESMADEFIAKGVGACTIADRPVDGLLFISSFDCDYQDEPQMCVRVYVDTGDQDATPFGIARGPASLGGIFVNRTVWNSSSSLVYAGRTALPFAVDSALNHAASGLQVFSD
jgi:hypothetical protein